MKMRPKTSIAFLLLIAAVLLWWGLDARKEGFSHDNTTVNAPNEPSSATPPAIPIEALIHTALDPNNPNSKRAIEQLVTRGESAVPPLLNVTASTAHDLDIMQGLYPRFEQDRPTEDILAEVSPLNPGGIEQLTTATSTLIKIGPPAVPYLLNYINVSGRLVEAYCLNHLSIYVLGEIRDPNVTPDLVKALSMNASQSDRYLRYRICLALGKIADERTLPVLIAMLTGEDYFDPDSAQQALVLLGPMAVEALLPLLQAPEQETRIRAINTLGDIQDERAIEPLIQQIGHEDVKTIRAAIYALGKMKATEAVDILLANLGHDDINIRHAAAGALGQIGEPALEGLLQAVQDEKPAIRAAAVQALGVIGNDLAVEALLKTLDDSVYNVRFHTVAALGTAGDPQAIAPLITVLNHPCLEGSLDSQAATALGQIGNSRAVAALIDQLDNPSVDVRKACAYALGNIGDQTAQSGLIACLQDNDAKVRKAAATVLKGMNYQPTSLPEKVAYLIALDHDSSYQEIVTIGYPAVEPLLKVLNDPDPDVKAATAEALGQIGDVRAVEPLIHCLQTTLKQEIEGRAPMFTHQATQEIVTALGRFQDERIIEPFIDLLNNPNITPLMLHKHDLIEILGAMKAKQAIPALQACLTNQSYHHYAVDALSNMGWTPQSIEDTVHVHVAKGHYDTLKQQWEQTQEVLLNDLHCDHVDAVENAAVALILLGHDTVVPELIKVMNESGNTYLVSLYLNSNNEELESAAQSWAHSHGYTISRMEGGTSIKWNQGK